MEYEDSKLSILFNALSIVGVLGVSILLYVLFDTHNSNHTLSKDQFVCTKIEQKGKSMHDVVCVQYTHLKYHEAAIALNNITYVAPNSTPPLKDTKKK